MFLISAASTVTRPGPISEFRPAFPRRVLGEGKREATQFDVLRRIAWIDRALASGPIEPIRHVEQALVRLSQRIAGDQRRKRRGRR